MGFLAGLLAAAFLIASGQAVERDRLDGGRRRRIVVVAAWNDCDTDRPDMGLKPIVETESMAIVQALKDAAGIDPGPPLLNPTRETLLATLEASPAPFWLIYSGHGGHEGARSVMCLPGPNLALAQLIDRLPSGVTASFWFNACLSAAVDVARPGTSVFSASPLRSRTAGDGTLIGAAITRAIRGRTDTDLPTDANCDGLVTDRELFEATTRSIDDPKVVTKFPARPKLISQAWADVPLFNPRVRRAGCGDSRTFDVLAASHPALRDAFAREQSYRRGAIPVDEREPPVVWVTRAAKLVLPGVVAMGRDEIAWLGKALLASRVWEISVDGRRPAIRDLRDPELPALWQGAAGMVPPAPTRPLELQLLRTPPEPAGEDGRRYARPLTPAERKGLADEGFVACGCEALHGQCFRKTTNGKGERK